MLKEFLEKGKLNEINLGVDILFVEKRMVDYSVVNKFQNKFIKTLTYKNNASSEDYRFNFLDNLTSIEVYFFTNECYELDSFTSINSDINIYDLIEIFEKLNLDWELNVKLTKNHLIVIKIINSGVNIFIDLDSKSILKMSLSI